MGRAPCCDKNNVKRGPWSPDEDDLLKNYIQDNGHGGNWIILPQKAGLKRCGKSCRLRWLNYLRPGIKHGAFTQQEDNTIFTLYQKLGSKWSRIASHLPGRTDNDVKNYWNTKLRKKLLLMNQQATDHHTLQSSSEAPPLPPLRHLGIKAEDFSYVEEEFTEPLRFDYVVSNGPYCYYSEAQPYDYSVMGLMENKQVVSTPLMSDGFSAASSSVTGDNASSSNSLMNQNAIDVAFFSEFGDALCGYGDAYYNGFTYS